MGPAREHLSGSAASASVLSSFTAGNDHGAGAETHPPAGEEGAHPPAEAAAGEGQNHPPSEAPKPAPPAAAAATTAGTPQHSHAAAPQDVAHLKRIYNENSGPAKPDEDDVKYPPGRTSTGKQCDCTDPDPQVSKILKDNDEGSSGFNAAKKMVGMKKGANHAALGHDAVALELEKQQRLAERRNANQSMKEPLQEFDQAKREYDKAREDAGLDYSNYMSHRAKYDHAFWELKAYHDGLCRKFMDKHVGIVPDCEPQFRLARSGYFARRRWPRCFVGQTSLFDHFNADGSMATEASLAGLLPLLPLFAAAGRNHQKLSNTTTCAVCGSCSTSVSSTLCSTCCDSSTSRVVASPSTTSLASSCSASWSDASPASLASDGAAEGDSRGDLSSCFSTRRPTSRLELSLFL